MYSSARLSDSRVQLDFSQPTGPWRSVLERFGVPFVVFGSADEPVVSPDAERILRNHAGGSVLRSHLGRLAQEARATVPIGSRTGGSHLVREVPSTDGTVMLAVYTMQEAGGSRSIVVVFRPSDFTASAAQSIETCLTSREREVASLIALGHGTKSIAAELRISTHTARHHTERVFSKLGVQSRASVAAIVSRARLGGSSHGLGQKAGE